MAAAAKVRAEFRHPVSAQCRGQTGGLARSDRKISAEAHGALEDHIAVADRAAS